MNKKLEEYFYKKYPILFENSKKPMTETCMCWGICINDGWSYLLDNLCNNIMLHIKNQHYNVDIYKKYKLDNDDFEEKIPQVKFDQVKEKFSSLRIYYSGGDDVIKNMINYTEQISSSICEECGKFDYTVGKTTKGWIHTICDECASKEKNYKKESGWMPIYDKKFINIINKIKSNNKPSNIDDVIKKIKKLHHQLKK